MRRAEVVPMRLTAALLFGVPLLLAQFRSTVPLVVAPTTVKDARGNFVDGLEERDLVLYDNNVARAIHLDFEVYPISLVVAVQTGTGAGPVLDKLGGSGILFDQLLAGDAGETAVLSYADQVKVRREFTRNSDEVAKTLRSLRVEGDGACALDAIQTALRMLAQRPTGQRRIVLVIGEKHERHSQVKLPEVAAEAQRQNALIYWLPYSPSWTGYTQRWKTVKSDDPKENGKAIPPDLMPNLLNVFPAIYHASQPDLAALFTQATGARSIGFLKKSGLEEAIQAVGEEVHRQYILSYQPGTSAAVAKLHTLRVEVKGRPELQVRTRSGYWPVQ